MLCPDNLLAVLQTLPDGVVLLDAQDGVQWCNRAACEHFGLQAERPELPLTQCLPEPGLAAWLASGMQGVENSLVLPVQRAGVALRRLSLSLYPRNEGQRVLHSRDITALETADTMRRDFVANVSHEIRTPLTVLMGFVETMQTLPLSQAERGRYLDLMAQQAQRMHHLVQDLLTLSRLEAAPPPGLDEHVSVAALLQHCEGEARALSGLLVQGAQHIRFPGPQQAQAAGHLAGSAAELQSALVNLVNNAVRYTPAGGHIRVIWQALRGGGACFAVKDSGPGIAAEHLPRITERFYRADRSRSRGDGAAGGTGLGLAIVKHVVQRHDGVLHVRSRVGQGSVFSVEFPAARCCRA